MGFRLTVPVIAYHARYSLNASLEVISLLFISFIALRALSSIMMGYIVEFHRRFMYIPSLFMCLNAVVTIMFSWSKDLFSYTSLRAVQGMLSGGSWPFIQLTLALLVPVNIRGRIMAIYFMIGSLGIFLSNLMYASLCGLSLALQLTISSLFLLLAAISFLIAVHCSFPSLVSLKQYTRPSYSGERREIKPESIVKPMLIGVFVISFVTCYTMGELSYVYVVESLSVSREVAAIILGVTGVIGLIASYVVSWIGDKYSDVLAMFISIFFSFIWALFPTLQKYYILLYRLKLNSSVN